MIKNIVVLCLTIIYAKATPASYDQGWHRRWFPHDPNETVDANPSVVREGGDQNGSYHNLFDEKHGVVMGVVDSRCDNGVVNLTLDWFDNPLNYTCFDDKSLYQPKAKIHPIHSVEPIPPAYSAPHRCMNETIEYNEVIPTFGAHRPLWAKYGEYKFLPMQRWLHNLEHGAVTMLYHPCANQNEIQLLKKLVKGCLYRHVITPYNLLSPNRPLALVTWGHRLEMSKVAPEVVKKFIKEHALHGHEKTHKDGQYDYLLIEHATVVSDLDDVNLCANFNNGSLEMK